ncbi:STAS domain-containing protein [Peribacillus sp. SCS-26]|uniref:STAS domain-containing protein n=1 Tax=Paraperibacillus marinus TaxID=3115295 RepID=UPI00390580BD
MTSINQTLYDFIISHSQDITEAWFLQKESLSGPFYSKIQMEKVLIEQHSLTIRTIAHAFLGSCPEFDQKVKDWAEAVATSRIENNTPIHEVIEALSKTRETIWKFIERFCENEADITVETIIKWSEVFNSAFDRLIYEFSARYHQLATSRLTAQASLITELSTPIIPILEEVAVLPIVGDIDTARARSFLELAPQKCQEMGIRQLFIDISGVSLVDTMVANEMYKLINVLSLLGVKTFISGMRPEVAQTSIQLGLNFTSVPTFSSLKQALANIGVGSKN